jgi:endogenous inhibitor of DNA gyrase (YacG/DUF329 family)
MSASRHRCPNCRRELDWDTTNRWRPFCSERCKLIDLGAWVMEERRIPGEEAAIDTGTPDDDTDDTRTH